MSIRTMSMPVALLFGIASIVAPACGGDAAEGESSDDTTGTHSSDDDTATTGGDVVSPLADGTADPAADGGVGPGTDPTIDQCTNEEIQLISTLNIESVMNDCTAECIGAGTLDIPACVASCVGEDSGLGDACAGCFGGMVSCVMANCIAFCPADEEACNACAAEQCSADLSACIGVVDTAGGETFGECLNEVDAAVAELGLEGVLDNCPRPCAASGAAEGCMMECALDTGFSDGCSSCFGALGQCIGSACAEACTAEFADQAVCMGCVADNCGDEFFYCSGLELEAPESPDEVTGGCLGSEDKALLESPDNAIATCMGVCAGETNLVTCLDECLAMAGFSADCSGCMGALMACSAENCPDCSQAASGDAASEQLCEACMAESCAAEEAACFDGETQGGEDEGLCINPEDDALLNGPDDIVDLCMGSCVMEPDTNTCVWTCLQEQGVTSPCSGCMADLMSCVTESCAFSCSPESQALDGGASCELCVDQSCVEEVTICFGDKSGEAPPVGPEAACGNTSDDALLASEGDPHAACSFQCLGADDASSCLTACLVEAGLSDACSGCLGDLTTCVSTYCGAECDSDEAGQACEECIQVACGQEHADCFDASGEQGPVGDPLCQGEDDAMIMATNPDLFQSCTVACADVNPNATCITNCLAEAGLSGGCSNCIAWMLGCMFESCPAECIGSDDEAACDECIATSCAQESLACFGDPGEASTDPPPGGLPSELCVNEQNSPILDADPDPTFTCAETCFGESNDSAKASCVSACLAAMGVTQECSDCLGEMVTCSITKCLSECMSGDAACQLCMGSECQAEIDACYAP